MPLRVRAWSVSMLTLCTWKYRQIVAKRPCSSGATTFTIDRLPVPWTVTVTWRSGRRTGVGATLVAAMLRNRSPSASHAALSKCAPPPTMKEWRARCCPFHVEADALEMDIPLAVKTAALSASSPRRSLAAIVSRTNVEFSILRARALTSPPRSRGRHSTRSPAKAGASSLSNHSGAAVPRRDSISRFERCVPFSKRLTSPLRSVARDT